MSAGAESFVPFAAGRRRQPLRALIAIALRLLDRLAPARRGGAEPALPPEFFKYPPR